MVVIRETSLLERSRVSRNLFSSPKSSVQVVSDKPQSDCNLNDRVAERFFVKRTKRSYDLSGVSKRNFMVQMMQTMKKLKKESVKIGQAMQCKGLNKKPVYFLGPKVASSPEDRINFVTPKRYACDYCNATLFNVSAYLKHLRKHKLCIRCSGCNQSFDNIVNKRQHELYCPKKAKLRF